MAKQLNVNLAFSADTQKAKAQIAELYKTLNQVSASSASSSNLFNTAQLKEGVTAAKELQRHLNAAVDVNTGKLNLSAFSASLKSSGKNLSEYKSKLEALGPAGENAFLQVSRSIATADAPLRKTSTLLKDFSTTLKNTARWQISSSVLHGFMGAVQSAYGYTQDLNESLNNIRIVTGNNTEQMAKFAKEANRAAKALSATTTEYTNASLIYYQQGLNEQQVKERTDITIKMANVARESAETVSDQLTAVWNNFYENGTQPLEHYADAMTALGAATASSTDEIAGGLEKFASIADMIGLSFDNAAAALATITATTRQSEDVVGTALKTIFARIQGLNLGETLDDGTTLNKYSEALNKVGISIYDAAGGLKDMDSILAEMGAKWDSLDKAQQTALAQTVAGVRQYNQLVSLMENFDFYEQNIMTAQMSDGTLNAQADIYAESWEAAQDRVKAAAENIYDSLLDDNFFIKFTDAFGVLLEGVGGFIDGLGGMEGVLSMVGGFITQKLAKEAPAALETIKQNLMQISGKAHQIADETQKNNIIDLKDEAESSKQSFKEGVGSLAYAAEISVLEKIATLKNQLNQYQDQYSEKERASAEAEIAHLEQISDILVKKGQRYDKLNNEALELERTLSQMGADFAPEDGISGVDNILAELRNFAGSTQGLKVAQQQISNLKKALDDPKASAQELVQQMRELTEQTSKTSSEKISGKWKDLASKLDALSKKADLTTQDLKELFDSTKGSNGFTDLDKDLKDSNSELNNFITQLKNVENVDAKSVDAFVAKLKEMGLLSSETQIGLKNVDGTITDLKPHVASASEAITSFSGALMQMNAFMNSMGSIRDVFSDEDATAIEKMSALMSGLTAGFMMFNAVSKLTTTLMALETAEKQKSAIATFLAAVAKGKEATVESIALPGKLANVAATTAQTLANWGLNASMAPILVVALAIIAAFATLTAIIWGVTSAIKALKAASPEGQLKKAEEEARSFADALNEAKQEAEDLKSAFDEYNSIQEELDKCTKGTEKWTEALLDANNQVLQLMSDYPELAAMVNDKGESAITSEDGRMKIADWAMEALEDSSNQKVVNAQGAYFAAQNNVRDKQLALDKSNIARDMSQGQYAQFKYDDSSANVASVVSSLILKNQKEFEGKSREDIAASLQTLFDDNGIIASVDSWTDVVLDTQDDFASLNATVEANTAAVKAQNEALMTSYLADNNAVKNSQYKDQIISASADQYDAEYNAKYNELVKTNLAGAFGVGTAEGKAMAESYAKTAGLQGFKVTNYRNDQTIDYTYQQEDGTTSDEINISVKAMAEIIAASEALAAVGDNAEALTAKFNQLYNSTDAADNVLADFVAYKNLENASADDVASLQDAITSKGGVESYLIDKLGAENVTDEMVTNLQTQLDGYAEMAASVGEGMLKAAKDAFDSIDTSSLSISGKETVANVLEQALILGGEEGLNQVQGIIGSLKDGELDEFTSAIGSIDWNTIDINTLDELLKDAGVTTDFTSEQLQNFIDSMREAGIASTESLTSRYAEVAKISKGLEYGDTISQEDYMALGEEYQGYFQMMLDGTYKLVESAEDFQNSVKAIEIGKFQEAMAQMTEENSRLEKLKDYDIEGLSQSQNYVDESGDNKYNLDNVNKQFEVLSAYDYDAEQIAKWKEDIADGTTVQVLQDIANAVNEVGFSEDSLTEKIQTNNEVMANYDMAIAQSCSNMRELKDAYDNGLISAQAFNTTAFQMHEAMDTADLDPEEWADYADHIQEAAESMEDFNSNMTDEESKIVAKGIMKMNDAIDDLADNFGDWKDVLKKSTKGSEEYSKALKGTQKAVSNLLDVSEDYVSDDFVVEHLEDIEKAATGDAEAIDRLKAALSEQIILDIVGVDKFSELPTNLQNAITQVQSLIDSTDIKVGETLNMDVDDSGFIEACNEIIRNAGMTADQANAYFDALGFETAFVTEPQEQTQRVPQYVTETIDLGSHTTKVGDQEVPMVKTMTRTYQDGYYEATGFVDAIAMETSSDGSPPVPKIQSMTKKASGSANNYSGSNSGGGSPGGGGGGKSTKPTADARKKKNDMVDRYKEVNDQLDDIADAMDDASKAADRLYGNARIKQMEKVSQNLQTEISLLKKKKEEAEKNLGDDKTNLEKAAKDVGVSFQFAGNNIVNYTEQMTDLYNRREALLNTFGDEMDETEQKKLEELDKKIEEFEKALGLYEETKELIEDIENEIDDAFYEWQDNNYEMLTYKLELEIEINDAELQYMEYLLNKYSDDFYKMAESAALLSGQLTPRKDSLSDYASLDKNGNLIGGHAKDLTTAYNNNEISQADYIDGLKETRDGIYGELEALIDLDKQMMHYYEDTLSAASEELDDYTDHMEHLTGVFDHYVNLMEILGKQKDYDAMGNFLSGKADTLRDRLDVAQEYYEVMLGQRAVVEQELNAAIARGDEAAIELHKKEWDAIVDATDEAQEEVLSLTEEWAEAMKAVIENNMAEIGDTLEKALTKGLGFEKLMDDFDKLNERQEEYLTKTNQVYETNKLMRTASKALDETDNKVAKQKLKNFIDETKSLQENTQLSEYELEIQQAKYDLLLAEIALEEAQNAKSTVRLSRDNEGNFGYVYTADQDKVSDAEQGVEDAKNSLYNISLEGQQDYTSKYLQSLQSFYEQQTELDRQWKDGEIASEELYQQMKTDLMEHYFGENGVLTTYSHLYNIAVQTDAAATADYWGQEYGLMTQNTSDWKTAVDQYLIDIEEQTENWKDISEQCNEDVGDALEDSETATKELKDESKALRDQLVNSVVPGIKTEIEAVKSQTTAYANQRAELQRLISTYEAYLRTLNQQIANESKSSGNSSGEVKTPVTDEKKPEDTKKANASSIASEAQAIVKGVHNGSIAQTGSGWKPSAKAAGYSDEAIKIAQKAFNDSKSGGGYDYYYDEALKLAGSYDTGGYTGSWGPEGKMAILHEKELVLNSQDTENILSTVAFIRDIISMIDSQANISSMFNMSATSGISTGSETLEQSVTIHAEFPNATNHNEIEEAFNNLVNRASQYANRR